MNLNQHTFFMVDELIYTTNIKKQMTEKRHFSTRFILNCQQVYLMANDHSL